jgi:hypothetical protein
MEAIKMLKRLLSMRPWALISIIAIVIACWTIALADYAQNGFAFDNTSAGCNILTNGCLMVSVKAATANGGTLILPSSVTYTQTPADTACHNVSGAHMLGFWNKVNTAQPNPITIFLNESSALCTSTVSYQITLGPSQIITPMTQGWPINSGTGFSYQQTTVGVTTIELESTSL